LKVTKGGGREIRRGNWGFRCGKRKDQEGKKKGNLHFSKVGTERGVVEPKWECDFDTSGVHASEGAKKRR